MDRQVQLDLQDRQEHKVDLELTVFLVLKGTKVKLARQDRQERLDSQIVD